MSKFIASLIAILLCPVSCLALQQTDPVIEYCENNQIDPATLSEETKAEIRMGYREHQLFSFSNCDVIRIGINGEFKFMLEPSADRIFRGHKALFDFLHQDAVRNDLELDSNQIKQFEKAGQQLDHAIREFGRMRNSGQTLTLQTRRKNIEKLEIADAAARDKLAELLLPHQKKRIHQLILQQNINETGLVGQLLVGPLGKRLEISEIEKDAIRRIALREVEELKKETRKIRKRIVDELLDCLTESQTTIWHDSLVEKIENTPLPTGLMISRLKHQDRLHSAAISKKDLRKHLDGFFYPNVLKLDANGQLIETKWNGSLTDSELDAQSTSALFELVGTPSRPGKTYADFLELDIKQTEAVRRFFSRYQQMLSKTPSGLTLEQFKEWRKSHRQRVNAEQKQFVTSFLESLSESQLKKLEQVSHSNAVYRRGILACLKDGPLCEKLKVTKEQKRKLDQASSRLHGELIKTTNQLHSDFESRILKGLNPENRKQFEKLVDTRLKNAVSNLDLLLIQSDPQYAVTYTRPFRSHIKYQDQR